MLRAMAASGGVGNMWRQGQGTDVTDIEIRSSRQADRALLEALYPQAFPEEDLLPVLVQLLEAPNDILSLVACHGEQPAGHVIFTRCTVDTTGERAALLGPLCVAPALQRQGIGGKLIREGLRLLAAEGIGPVYVLGDPAYYGRHGFSTEAGVATPYPLPADWGDAWQSQCLIPAHKMPSGTLVVPKPWQDPVLWAA